MKNDMIAAVVATFVGAPYYIRSPFVTDPDPVYDAHQGEPGPQRLPWKKSSRPQA